MKNGLYFKSSRSPLTPYLSYLPEPYYGSIASEKGTLCAILDLNPGLSHPNDYLKIHGRKGASLYDDFHNNSYSVFNKMYSPFLPSSISTIGKHNEIPGVRWWKEKRMKWILSFYKKYKNHRWSYHYFPVLATPIVFELCPWHSKVWNNSFVSGMGAHLTNIVFEPAAEAIDKSGLPFGFCFGKVTGDILLKNGFSTLKEWSNNNPTKNWPISNKTGKPVARSYRLLKGRINEAHKDVFFLNLFARGSFRTPDQLFQKDVEPEIIKWLKANI